MGSFSTRLLLAAYFLEAGLVLIVVPWYGNFWDRNFFAEAMPVLDELLASPYARGAVSGVGLITMLGGFAELGAAFASRRHASAAPGRPTFPLER